MVWAMSRIGVDDSALRADGGDDEVAVPGRELFERREQLLPLGAACRAANSLLRLAGRQVERLELRFRGTLRLGGTFTCPVEDPLRCVARLELGIRVDGARNFEQGFAPARRLGVEQTRSSVETTRGEACERSRLVGGEPGRTRADLLPDGTLGKPREGNELAARANRLRQRPEVVGDEQEHRVRRRLLQVLEERVRGVLVHRVRTEDEVDAP